MVGCRLKSGKVPCTRLACVKEVCLGSLVSGSCRKRITFEVGKLTTRGFPCMTTRVPVPRAQERLDPIDWATYEPYLWANEAAQQPRTAVLFGALTRLSGARPSATSAAARAPGGPPGEANVMALGPPAPRFSYLPISMPSLAPDGGLRRGNGGAPSAGGGSAMPGVWQRVLSPRASLSRACIGCCSLRDPCRQCIRQMCADAAEIVTSRSLKLILQRCISGRRSRLLFVPPVVINQHLSCGVPGGEQGLGDYSFSGFKSPRGAEAGDSAAEQAAQSAAASTFEVGDPWSWCVNTVRVTEVL